jgi:hypothetical protein
MFFTVGLPTPSLIRWTVELPIPAALATDSIVVNRCDSSIQADKFLAIVEMISMLGYCTI